jgi:membrane protease YdiL (CAAX protease family)
VSTDPASADADRQHTRARPELRWGLGDVVGGMVAGLMASSVLASIWLGATGDEDLSLGGQALSQVGLWFGLVGAVVLAARRKGSGSVVEDFGFRGRAVDLALGLAVGIATHRLLLPLIALLMRPLVGEPEVSGPTEDLFKSAHGVETVFLVLFVVVGAAIVEELFFRGLLLRALQRRLGTAPAVAISSVVFGIAHPQPLPGDALALVWVSLTALGVVLALLAVRTGRLGASIVAHAAFNGLTALLILT